MPDIIQLLKDATASKEYAKILYTLLPKLFQAADEGKIIELPCKVGDTVYALQPKQISEFCVDPLHKEIVVAKIVEITLKNGIEWLRLYSDDDRIANYRGENFGKTVFLTRESAEAALKERKA